MNWKKIGCAALAALILSGCKAPAGGQAAPDAPDDSGGCAPPAGLFVERDIFPPALREMGKYVDSEGLFAHGDGSVDYFVTVMDPEAEAPREETWMHFSSPDAGGAWEIRDMGWLDKLREGEGLFPGGGTRVGEIRMDENKNIYCLAYPGKESAGTDGDNPPPFQLPRLIKVSPEGGAEEVSVVDFENRSIYDELEARALAFFDVLPDGSLLFGFDGETRWTLVYDGETGERLHSLREGPMEPGDATVFRKNCFVTETRDELKNEGRLATYGYDGEKLSDGPSTEGMRDADNFCALRAGENKEIYAFNRDGVSRCLSDGSYWERLMDGSRYAFGQAGKDILLTASAPGGNTFYMALRDINRDSSGWPAPSLYRYAYDESAPAIPEGTLSVFAMEESAALSQAVAVFQKNYPDCRIDLRIPPDGMPPEEASRILQKELAEGQGPDILMMDGLSVTFFDKLGVLDDLSDIAKSDAYFTNLTSAYETGGKVPAIPALAAAPMMTGDRALLNTLRGLPDLVEAAKNAPPVPEGFLLGQPDGPPLLPDSRRPLVGPFQPYDAARLFYGLYAPDLDGPEGEEKLTELLSLIKALWEVYDEPVDEKHLEWAARPEKGSIPSDGFSPVHFYRGLTRLGVANCGYMSIFQDWSDSGYQEVEGEPVYPVLEFEPLFGRGIFYPSRIAAVNAASVYRERARDFVRTLLSEEVLSEDNADNGGEGLPVNRAALEKGIHRDPWITYAGDPTALIESLRTPSTMDQAGLRALMDELPAYLGAEESAEEAARHILEARAPKSAGGV